MRRQTMSAAIQAAEESILLRRDVQGVAYLTLNRPNQFNALSMEMLDALLAELDRIAAQPEIRVVVIGGAGKAFAPGTTSRRCGPIM